MKEERREEEMQGKGFRYLLLAVGMAFLLGIGAPSHGEPVGPREEGKVWKKLSMLRMWRLTEELDLTQEEAAKVFPIIHKYDKKRASLRKERREILQKLRRTMNEEGGREEITALMGRLEANGKKLDQVKEEEWKELKAILPLKKQVRYLLFQERFAREMWRLLREGRRPQRRPRPPLRRGLREETP